MWRITDTINQPSGYMAHFMHQSVLQPRLSVDYFLAQFYSRLSYLALFTISIYDACRHIIFLPAARNAKREFKLRESALRPARRLR